MVGRPPRLALAPRPAPAGPRRRRRFGPGPPSLGSTRVLRRPGGAGAVHSTPRLAAPVGWNVGPPTRCGPDLTSAGLVSSGAGTQERGGAARSARHPPLPFSAATALRHRRVEGTTSRLEPRILNKGQGRAAGTRISNREMRVSQGLAGDQTRR